MKMPWLLGGPRASQMASQMASPGLPKWLPKGITRAAVQIHVVSLTSVRQYLLRHYHLKEIASSLQKVMRLQKGYLTRHVRRGLLDTMCLLGAICQHAFAEGYLTECVYWRLSAEVRLLGAI